MNNIQALIFSVLLAAASWTGTEAAEAPAELSPVVTTANRIPTALQRLTTPVIVISRSDIELSQAQDLAELLRFHAGLDLGRNGGPGQNTGLFLRGTESNHTLVLVDGVEINPATLGGAAIQNLRPDIIERVEIVKGPRSALWGSAAIGGVVNVITRKAGNGLDYSASVGAGPDDTRIASAEARFGGRRSSFLLGFANLDTDGFPTRSESALKSAHDNTTAQLKMSTLAGRTRLTGSYWEARGNTEYLDFFLAPVEQDYRNSVLAAELAGSFASHWSSTLIASAARDEIQQLNSADYVHTRRISFDWQNTLMLGERHTLLAGIEVSEEHTESLSFGSFFEDTTGSTELFLSNAWQLGRHDLLLAARHTDHDGFGSAFTWNLEHGLQVGNATRLTAGIGTGFRAPDGTDRFGFGGNPDLRAERSRNVELGFVHQLSARARVSLSAYQHDISDLIEFEFDPVSFEGGNLNVGRARIRGLDLAYDGSAGAWRWQLGLVLQDPENKLDGSTLARRARRSLSARIARDFAWGRLGSEILASGERRDSPFGNTQNAGFVLANLTGQVKLGAQTSLNLRLENLLDSRYQTAAGFNSPGRGLYVSLDYGTN